MKNNKITEEKQADKPKRSFISIFFGKQEPDKAYMSDLKLEWQNMDQKERIKFVLGAVFGLILFISALIVVYIFLSSMMR
jgi:hypothetical protein